MKTACIIFFVSCLVACTQQRHDDEYWCSFETDPEVHKNCLEVGRDLDEHTAESAGHKVPAKKVPAK